jgi:hypothetical protein
MGRLKSVGWIKQMVYLRNRVNVIEKLKQERIKMAKVRIMLMDIVSYSNQPHIQRLANDALGLLNDPVDKSVGTKR